jgi:uncharacterized membrane protein
MQDAGAFACRAMAVSALHRSCVMSRLGNVWDGLRSSFWFVPAIMTGLAATLSFAMIAIDRTLSAETVRATGGYSWLYTGGSEGARTLLSTVAGSIVTVVGVTFSVTVVSLQLASSQFGPRLLRNFMRDRGNQSVLGTLVATFMYCLLVLRTVRGEESVEDASFVPHLAVTLAVLLAAACVTALIYFIHHVSASIQAENVVASVSRELHGTIDRLFPERVGGLAPDATPPPAHEPVGDGCPVIAAETGYVQMIDGDALLAVTSDHDVVVRVLARPGRFVAAGTALALVSPAEGCAAVARDIRNAFVLGPQRTPFQDVEFGITQLVDIAVRALSPSINDPRTATACVDWLGAALLRLGERERPSPYRCDDEGRLRVIADPVTVTGVVDATFNDIRQNARSSAAVTIRLLETIDAVGAHTSDAEMRSALLRQAVMIERGSRDGLAEPGDRHDVDERFRRLVASFGQKSAILSASEQQAGAAATNAA